MEPVIISDELRTKLGQVVDKTSIAGYILSCETNKGAEGDYIDYLGISEDNPDYISYLNAHRIRTLDPADYWSHKKRYHTKPAAFIEKLFPNTFTQREKEVFTELFRNESLKEKVVLNSNVQIVKGEDIRKYYLDSNYYDGDDDVDKDHTLWSSCMRYSHCQKYLDLYVLNPELVSMAVMFSEDGLVKARCILWTHEGITYYDRIYAINNSTDQQMQAAMEAKKFINISDKNIIKPNNEPDLCFPLQVGENDLSYFPYMDTMYYIYNNKISSEYISGGWEMRETNGSYERNADSDEDEEDSYYCECGCCGRMIYDGDDAYYIERGRYAGSDLCDDCCIYSEHEGGYIHADSSISLDYPDDSYVLEDDTVQDYKDRTILREDAKELYNDEYAHEDDPDLEESEDGEWFVPNDDDEGFVYVENHGWYLEDNDQIEEIDGEWYLIGSPEYENALEQSVINEEQNV